MRRQVMLRQQGICSVSEFLLERQQALPRRSPQQEHGDSKKYNKPADPLQHLSITPDELRLWFYRGPRCPLISQPGAPHSKPHACFHSLETFAAPNMRINKRVYVRWRRARRNDTDNRYIC